MALRQYAVFGTAIGYVGIVWSSRGVAGMQLPEATEHATREQLARRFPGATDAEPPPEVAHAIDSVRTLLRGEAADLSDVHLDMDELPEFQRAVYAIARSIPPGTTLTYGDVAARTGTPRDARAVGQALGANPFPIIVPCHRVVAADGRMHGFSGPGGVGTKLRLLQIEGYEPVPGPSLFD